MESRIFENNISILRKKDPSLAARLLASRQIEKRWNIVPTRNDAVTLRGELGGGRILFLHSKYDPQKEARQIVDSYEYSPTADLVILGFGLGYHVREIMNRHSKHGFIMICEPEIEIIVRAFECFDFRDLLHNSAVIWSVGEPSAALFNKMTSYSISILANTISVLEHPASVQIDPAFYEKVKKTVYDVFTWTRVNANTQIAKAKDFAHNILTNVPQYLRSPGIDTFFIAFPDVPVFIVSAGPSLDKNVQYLQEIGDRGIIICVDSAMRTLLNNDIRPDLVVSIDFGKHNIKYFNETATDDLVLAFDPEVHPDIPLLFKGRKFAINLPGKALCDWITAYVGDKGSVSKGLSVSHSAFSIALKMNAGPIVLVGQDLSYPRGAWHSKGSGIYQKAAISEDIKKRMVEIDGYFGDIVKSETSFTVFLNQFESLLHGLDIDCYNATEGGARIHGIPNITLRNAIKEFCVRPIDKSPFYTDLGQDKEQRDLSIYFAEGKRIVDKLSNANHHSFRAFQLVEKMIEEVQAKNMNKPMVIEAYKRVVSTVNMISEDQEILDLLKDNALEALIIRAKRELKTINDISFDETERVLRELHKEHLFFQTLVNACDFLAKEFCSSLNEVQKTLQQHVAQ